MSNERNAGKPPKYKKGTPQKKIHILIPTDAEIEIKTSISNITEKWKHKK